MNKGEAIDIAILHMALPENRNRDFDFYQLLHQLDVPEDVQKPVFHTMFQRDYISGPPALRSPMVSITKAGLHYADQLKEAYFLKHGRPLQADHSPAAALEETCELLFQLHKNNSYQVLWTKETYNSRPINLDVAKEVLLSRGVLYEKRTPANQRYTHLHPDFYSVTTCNEAFQMIEERNKPLPQVVYDNRITTHGDNSPASGRDTAYTQTIHPEQAKRKWYQKWWDEFIKNVVQFTFTGLVTFLSGLAVGKSCTPTDATKGHPPIIKVVDSTGGAGNKQADTAAQL